MEEFLSWLDSSPWLNFVFLILAVTGILTSIIIYLRGKREKAPYYYMRSFNLIKDSTSKIQNVRITYLNEQIDNLTVTKFALWNYGRETINSSDIAPKDKLRLELKSRRRFLDAKIIRQSKEANNFSIILDEKKKVLFIDFDYFDTLEGAIIQSFHTGTSSKDIFLRGTIKGVKKIKNANIADDYFLSLFLNNTFGFLNKSLGKLKIKYPKLLINFMLLFFAILFLPILVILILLDKMNSFRSRLPHQFDLK